MTYPSASSGPTTANSIFIPSLPLSIRVAGLLLSNRVQSIAFYFGHVHVLPEYFRNVAQGLIDGRIRVLVDATQLPSDAEALYEDRQNILVFRTNDVLETPAGRAKVVHECSHAAADSRRKSTAIRHEEAAAFICEAWYLDDDGINADGDHNVSDTFFAIATALKGRSGSPPAATGSEINDGRAEVAMAYDYENGFNRNDGF
jgi:hypothetical protein